MKIGDEVIIFVHRGLAKVLDIAPAVVYSNGTKGKTHLYVEWQGRFFKKRAWIPENWVKALKPKGQNAAGQENK